MTTFVSTKRLTWATSREVTKFVDAYVDAWEESQRTTEEVATRAKAMCEAASKGELQIDGKSIYVAKMASEFRARGIETRDESQTKSGSGLDDRFL